MSHPSSAGSSVLTHVIGTCCQVNSKAQRLNISQSRSPFRAWHLVTRTRRRECNSWPKQESSLSSSRMWHLDLYFLVITMCWPPHHLPKIFLDPPLFFQQPVPRGWSDLSWAHSGFKLLQPNHLDASGSCFESKSSPGWPNHKPWEDFWRRPLLFHSHYQLLKLFQLCLVSSESVASSVGSIEAGSIKCLHTRAKWGLFYLAWSCSGAFTDTFMSGTWVHRWDSKYKIYR